MENATNREFLAADMYCRIHIGLLSMVIQCAGETLTDVHQQFDRDHIPPHHSAFSTTLPMRRVSAIFRFMRL
jgi:hypothetical protein